MKRRNHLLILALSITFVVNAQTKIKDGTITSSALPNANAILELESNNKGFLLPRVALTATTSFAPLTAHIAGITVYNTAITGDVVPGIYYNDGAKWQLMVSSSMPGVNIYNSNGTLTANRVVNLDGKRLLFQGANGYFDIETGGENLSLYGTGSNNSRLRVATSDVDGDGVTSIFDIQMFADDYLQMFASGEIGGVSFGTHFTQNPSPIEFVTSPGGLALGETRMVIDGNGNVGINETSPTEKLDIGPGNVRIRDINSNIGTNGTDRTVVADANGVLKTLDIGAYALFHGRLAANQSLTAGTITTLLLATPLSTSSLYTYNTGTGTFTFNQPGNYLVTMQASFANLAATGTQLTMGVRPVPDAAYLGRGSHYNAAITGASVGELMNYTTMIVVPSAGYQVRFVAITNANSTVLATETGSTGSGNVTNITIQKI